MASSAVGLVLAWHHDPALGQEAAGAQGAYSEIVVLGRAGDDTPGAPSTTVDRERLDREGREKLDDALRTVPGVFTRQNPQQPGVAVNIRGFEGSGRVNMSIDGARQNFRFTGHEGQGFTYVDPNLLAGIDITRGEVTGIGGGALAGRVNFRTLEVQDVVRGDKPWGVLSRLSWGSNGFGFSEMISAAYRNEQFGVIGAISKRDSGHFRNGDGAVVPNTGQDLLSGLFKTNFAFGEGHTLALNAVLYRNDFFANSYFQTLNNRTFSAKYRYNPDNPLIDLRINGYANDLQMHYTGGTGSAVGRKINDRGLGFDISNTAMFELGPVGVRNTTGFEYFRDHVAAVNGGVNPGDGTSAVGGLFADTTFRYGIVELIAGLRYNFYSLKGVGTLPIYGSYTVDQSRGSLDPKITLAVNVMPWLQPYVSWGRSMRAPTLQETMLGGDHPGGTSVSMVPNPNLVPEKQQGWEFGVNVRHQGVFTGTDLVRLRANYYIKSIEDYIVGQSFPNASPPPPSYTYFINVPGTSRVRGFELEASYDARIVFASLGYARADSELPSQFSGLGASQYLPRDTLTVTAGARLLDEALTVGAQYKYVSGGLIAGYNPSFTGGQAVEGGTPYHLVDLFSTYRFNDHIDVSLKVTNLFNVQYTPFLSTTGTGPGRTFLASTQIRF